MPKKKCVPLETRPQEPPKVVEVKPVEGSLVTAVAFKSPPQLAKAIEAAGIVKANLSAVQMLVLGFLAGAYIAFGGFLAIACGSDPEVPVGIRKLVFGGVFPVGLMLVIIAGSELFTGNCAILMPALLNKKIPWYLWLKNWALVYLGNFVGSVFLAALFGYIPGTFAGEPWNSKVLGIMQGKLNRPWGNNLLLGIACNWLVCLAVYLAVAANTVVGKVWAIWFPIMAFVASGFEHSVANMFFVPLGLMYQNDKLYRPICEAADNCKTFGGFLALNLLPVTIGNIIGGSFLVGIVYWFLYNSDKKWEITPPKRAAKAPVQAKDKDEDEEDVEKGSTSDSDSD